MAYIQYRYDPNDPNSKEEARSKAYSQFYQGFILLWGSIGSLIYLIFNLAPAFSGDITEDLYYSAGIAVVMTIVDFFILSQYSDSKKQFAKNYFPIVYVGLIELSGLIAIIVSTLSVCHRKGGELLLVCSSVVVFIFTILLVVLYRRAAGYGPIKIKLLSDKNDICETSRTDFKEYKAADIEPHILPHKNENNTSTEFIYCHKCGKKLPADSMFCSSCGTRLR